MLNTLFRTLLLFSCLLPAASLAQTISGTVHNQTTGQPAAGDEVVLLRLGQGMQEEARTKTDAQGAFTLKVTSPADEHVLRVFHQGVNYDQRTSGAGTVELNVYDAVAAIPGLSGTVGVAQLQSDGKVLKVIEMYEIANTSNPPVTQSRPDNFQITLPAKGVIESAQVRSGKGLLLNVKPDPMKGKSGNYAINFPIRPGTTQFIITYHLPYNGSATLHLKVPYPIQRFGVLHPSSMSFKSLEPNAFQSAAMSPELRGEVCPIRIVGEAPGFQISGTGKAALHGSEAAAAPPPVTSAPPVVSAPPPTNAHNAPANAPSPADQSKKELVLMIAGIALILLLGGFTLWRMKRPRPVMVSAKSSGNPRLDALKEALFQLESDRLHGSISDEEYASTKQVLTKSIERAMGRG